MKDKKLLGLILALGMISASVLSVGQVITTNAACIDSADQSFLEFVLSDADYQGEIEYTHSPLYNEELEVNGRQYDFTIGDVEGYALLTEIQSINKTFYEVEELFYNKRSPFDECEGLPVYITHRVYLDYKDGGFYNVIDDNLVADTIVGEYAYSGFGYCGAWEFVEQYQTISYSTRSFSEYSIEYDLPNYYGPPGTTCASTAGAIVIGYYDRYFENLIPNFQVYRRFGNRISYKPISAETLNVANELYYLMGAEQEHLGTTYSEFQDGMATYVSSKGYTYSTSSLFSWGSFNFEAYKVAVQGGKPVALFLNSFAIKNDITTSGNVDTVISDYTNTAHIVIGCGYQQYKYYNSGGQEIDNRIYLKVATALNSYQIGFLNINGLSVINHAISIEIS